MFEHQPPHQARSCVLLFLAVMLLAASVSALEAGTPGADAVVLGRVVSSESRWTPDHLNIETAAQVAVDRVLDGSVGGATVAVTVPGGTVGDLVQVVVGGPVLETGTEGRFTLRADGRGGYTVAEVADLAVSDGAATNAGEVSAAVAPPGAGTAPGDGASEEPAGPVRRALDSGPVITSVSPQIASAGTDTTITITGTGFGTEGPGSDVGFTSYGGVYWASGRTDYEWNANDIVNWSDTEVRVRVPTGFSSDGYAVSASSGKVWVVTDANETSTQVPFAVSFGVGGEKWEEAPVFSVNDNCPGVAGGASAVRRAAATWNAALPPTFQIDCSGASANTTSGIDGLNLIAWGTPEGSTYWYDESNETILEADIILDPSREWTTGVAAEPVYNIETWVLSDLGFCIGIASLAGEEPQGPSDTGKVSFVYLADVYGNMNLLSLHPADGAAAAYLYNGESASPDLIGAAFTTDTITGPAPLAVQFGDASLGGATGWAWDFGDGNTSTQKNPAHTYASPGTYTVTLTASAPGHPDDTIRALDRITVGAGVAAVPGGAGVPTDTNADGTYEDVNGNGRKDFADVVLFFNQMTWIAANEPVALFDYNGNGRIDFADVVWLFNCL